MIHTPVLIVGGGPAGATCARTLKRAGVDVMILDKKSFPRDKPCAGWITPKVFRTLRISPELYPHNLTTFNRLHVCVRGRSIPIPTCQYAIRRIEFDHWLLQRAGVPIHHHRVNQISRAEDGYVIDGRYHCTYLVGAGGTTCPVQRMVFRDENPRSPDFQITTLEMEFPYHPIDTRCYLWFFDSNLPGYSWYVPKQDYLTIGIGGLVGALRTQGETIQQHWDLFIEKVSSIGLVEELPHQPKGYTYYLRHKMTCLQHDNAFLVGDAAGLATLDMGEGIGPAVQSGRRAAEAIITKRHYILGSLNRLSLFDILFSR